MRYVIMPKTALHDVINGRLTELPTIDPAPVGTVIAAKTARNRRPTVLLAVTACTQDPDGYVLTVRVHPHPHEPRLLAQDSTHGYTPDSRLALRDEPEAPPEEYVEELTLRAHTRYERGTRKRIEQARRDRELLGVERRIVELQRAAKSNHVDVSSEVFVLRKMLARGASVDHKLRQAEYRAYRERPLSD